MFTRRLHQSRRAEFRTGRPLGDGDRLLVWPRPPRSAICPLTEQQYAALPAALEVRMVRSSAALPEERVRQMILVTSLPEPLSHPADALAAIFRRRWQIELNFDDIQTALGMRHLACRSAEMALRMVNMHQCACNLIRAQMQRTAAHSWQRLHRMSFTAAARLLSGTGQWLNGRHRRSRVHSVRKLLDELIVGDPVPLRPGRSEPRAIKRRASPYLLLTTHRHDMKIIPHQKRYHRPSQTLAALSQCQRCP